MVYRAAALSGLTEADAATLMGIGLRTVCDLRGDVEQSRGPSRMPGVVTHDLRIEPSLGASLRDIAARREATGEDVMVLMRRAYTAYALEWSHRYRALFDLLLDGSSHPLLFHCTAGKDRTGFGAALLLTALGADEATVMADYLATNRLWRGDSKLADMLPAHVAEVLLKVHPELITTAFDAIRAAHGSVDAYLAERIGLDARRRAQLQALLLA
jgi:protein-tyrosine phosphatase